MKIGILTFHCAHNYGAVLQCYALQETLKKMGNSVEVINYSPPYLTNQYKYFYWRRFISKNPILLIKKSITELKILRKRILRYYAFHNFIHKNLHLSCKCTSKKIPCIYDIYIMGSDQIWNPNITEGFDPVFFGFFPFPKKSKVYISYAASMEKQNISPEESDYLSRALQNFDGISVREKKLEQYLQKLTRKKIQTVLDPTLLLPLTNWEKILVKPNITNYILVYQVRVDNNIIRIARLIAQQLNCKVIEISAGIRHHSSSSTLETSSPEEFLGLIKYSTFVITSSFHGTVFSILFKKDFFCIRLNDGADSRSSFLLESVGLSDRLIDKESSPKVSQIDYNSLNRNEIDKLKNNSLDFLQTYIKSALRNYSNS